MVVLYHALQAGLGEAAIAAWPNLSAGVDVFFVLSGFVMAQSCARLPANGQAAQHFLLARAIRIVPLYWALTAAKLAILLLLPGAARHTAPTAWNILASFLFIPARDGAGAIRPILAVGWTLNFEMAFYALIAGCLALGRAPQRYVPPLLVALAVLGLWRAPDWPAPFSLLHGFLGEFALGMAVFAGWRRWHGRVGPARPLVLALALIGLTGLLILPLAGPARALVWGGAASLLLCAALLAHTAGLGVPRAALVLGDASYAIYLLHGFCVPLLGPAWGAAASLPLGVVLDRAVERRWRRRLTQRLRPLNPAGSHWPATPPPPAPGD